MWSVVPQEWEWCNRAVGTFLGTYARSQTQPDEVRRKRVVRTPVMETGEASNHCSLALRRQPRLTFTESGSTLAFPTSGVSLGLTGLGGRHWTRFVGARFSVGGTVPGCMLGAGQVPWDPTAEIAVVPRKAAETDLPQA